MKTPKLVLSSKMRLLKKLISLTESKIEKIFLAIYILNDKEVGYNFWNKKISSII